MDAIGYCYSCPRRDRSVVRSSARSQTLINQLIPINGLEKKRRRGKRGKRTERPSLHQERQPRWTLRPNASTAERARGGGGSENSERDELSVAAVLQCPAVPTNLFELPSNQRRLKNLRRRHQLCYAIANTLLITSTYYYFITIITVISIINSITTAIRLIIIIL